MYEPKKDLYSLLSEISDVTVYQARPEIEMALPCIIFHVIGNTPEYVLEKSIGYQDVEVVIDIYASTSKESGELLTTLESKMMEDEYRLVFSSDILDDTCSHITTRFNLRY